MALESTPVAEKATRPAKTVDPVMQKYGLWVLCVICGGPILRAADPKPLTGTEFRRELDSPLDVSFENAPLRKVLAQIEQAEEIVLLRDRRIDPEQEMTLSASGEPLEQFLEQLAETVGARISELNGAVYLGPPEAARKLRTLIELRRADADKTDVKTRVRLLRSQAFAWNDLDTPRGIAERMAAEAELTIANPELIQHDLWPAGRLPDESVVAALSAVLIQFDLTFQLDASGARLTLVPVPQHVAVDKTYTLRRNSLPVESWKERLPGLETTALSRRQIRVSGTVEQHERVENFLRGKTGDEQQNTAQTPPGVPPLSRRSFTLALPAGVPASAVMQKLRESGIEFEYDAKALEAAGVDLNAPVKFAVKDARADEFFKAMFGPLGLDVKIAGVTVKLTPSAKSR